MKRIVCALALAAVVAAPLVPALAKYEAGTLTSRGATALTTVGGPLAPELQGKPVLVRIYAEWCPACSQTEPLLSDLMAKYAGRVRFVTFDVTNAHTAAAAEALAKRDGLAKFFDATKAATSAVALIDPKSGAVLAELYNDIDAVDYTKAIDKALAARS